MNKTAVLAMLTSNPTLKVEETRHASTKYTSKGIMGKVVVEHIPDDERFEITSFTPNGVQEWEFTMSYAVPVRIAVQAISSAIISK